MHYKCIPAVVNAILNSDFNIGSSNILNQDTDVELQIVPAFIGSLKYKAYLTINGITKVFSGGDYSSNSVSYGVLGSQQFSINSHYKSDRINESTKGFLNRSNIQYSKISFGKIYGL